VSGTAAISAESAQPTRLTVITAPDDSIWRLNFPNSYSLYALNYSFACVDHLYETAVNGLQQYCYNDRYICTAGNNGVTSFGFSSPDPSVIMTTTPLNYTYYIVDTQEQKTYGPFDTEADFNQQCSDLGVTGLCPWADIDTPPPNADHVNIPTEPSGLPPAGSTVKGNICLKDENGNIVLDKSDITAAKTIADKNQTGYYDIQLTLNDRGRAKFFDATARPQQQIIYFYIDDALVSSPTVQETITSYDCIISGTMDKQQADAYVQKILNG